MFQTKLGKEVFEAKFSKGKYSWEEIAEKVAEKNIVEFIGDSARTKLLRNVIKEEIKAFKFVPGGRYLYYAGLKANYTNNCFALEVEDTKESWADTLKKVALCLMSGGGVGINYSKVRGKGLPLVSSGGVAGGPLSLAMAVDSVSQQIQQGGTRRAALCANIRYDHSDVYDFVNAKKEKGVMPCTNISIIFDDLSNELARKVFSDSLDSAYESGEPGFFFQHDDMHITSACQETRFTESDSACNLGSINMARIDTIEEFEFIVSIATEFLIHGSMTSEMPYLKAERVKERNRTVGLGLMGVHEWLIKRGYRYEPCDELSRWLDRYVFYSNRVAEETSRTHGISKPHRVRAIAPTGTLSILAGTTGGIEPVLAHAYRRNYFYGMQRKSVDMVDAVTDRLVKQGIPLQNIQTAYDIPAKDRIEFQVYMQKYVDQAISSTVNFNPDKVSKEELKKSITENFDKLKGLTLYPNSSRDNQPIEPISYDEAVKESVEQYQEDGCKGGSCGL